MKKTPPFAFKKFVVEQIVNSQKVGTDSMLLGAWTSGSFQNILDIGTGTGILALMMAQKNPESKIVAIEPNLDSLKEGRTNFAESPFSNQIQGVHSWLQDFKSAVKFDLIISNPPYFQNSTLSEITAKNRTRHTNELPIAEFYKYASTLLKKNGLLNIIFPFELELIHFTEAKKFNFFPNKILRTKREDGLFKRSLISYSFKDGDPVLEEMVVKFKNNTYSQEYISLTKDFYLFDLGEKQK